jgi:hypothetical protein
MYCQSWLPTSRFCSPKFVDWFMSFVQIKI